MSDDEKKKLKSSLAEFATSPFPPCVQHIAKKLGVARGTLEAIDPQLCERITKSSDDHRNITVAVRFIRFRNQVDQCVKVNVAAGRAPTLRDIGASVKTPGMLRSPKCRDYARAEIKRATTDLAAIKPG